MWLPYVIGALLLIAGLVATYLAIVELRKEKATLASKGGYSYLKKN